MGNISLNTQVKVKILQGWFYETITDVRQFKDGIALAWDTFIKHCDMIAKTFDADIFSERHDVGTYSIVIERQGGTVAEYEVELLVGISDQELDEEIFKTINKW